ncbi:rhomboid family intramembrane serine protease [Candidatus Bathyarchaeota archaeon]|nr:rhomboid family intramembrane serine protease [Candidatus Bathyarchaeota archaeon]NIR15968.1 rhomboid family intramembrane serine protease [Desulfobacterales bacterium]NIU81376.1 rhomboid family intramembrane serine protease [Candidatus Bathyarchaeota archaeon]NIV67996.1 rhomboid family intramembrane serine protease [Candidatus Bathyarchaeota archaeon]NIW34536.1 rhomboid family intramembrane serine protease [Candidatus Bathyarchaeota archaeon]
MNRINWVIILCILTSALTWYWGSDVLFGYLAFSGQNLLEGRVWTLVTALFLHGDVGHLVGNMLFLFVFGNTLENELQANRTLLAFFLGGIVAFLLTPLFYTPATYAIGASAAIFTLTAVVMLVKPLKFSFLFLMPQGLVAIIYFLYNVVAVQLGTTGNIAYTSHIIGFLIGIPLGMAWSREWAKNLLITIGLLLLYLFLIWLVVPLLLAILL